MGIPPGHPVLQELNRNLLKRTEGGLRMQKFFVEAYRQYLSQAEVLVMQLVVA